MKKYLLVLLMSSSSAFSMNEVVEKSVTKVENRFTHTITARKESLELIVRNLSEEFDEEINLGESRVSHEKSFQCNPEELLNTMLSFDFERFFNRLNEKVLKRLGTIDPTVYDPINQFVGDMQSYFNRLVSCESDEQMAKLLKDIETDKELIIEKFSLCAPVILQIGQVCVNEVYKQCIAGLPGEVKKLLPALEYEIKKLASGFVNEGSGGLNIIMTALSNKSVSRALGMAESLMASCGSMELLPIKIQPIEIPPMLRRTVGFVEGCAKISLSTTINHKGRLMLTYTPSEKQTFPLNDDYFKGKTFEDLGQDAYNGELFVITTFAERFTALLKKRDKDGTKNLLSFAILGYCAGKDNAWKVLAYLLDQDLEVSDLIQTFLSKPSTDSDLTKKNDRDSRKAQVKELIEIRDEFYKSKGNGALMLCPQEPLSLVVKKDPQNQGCIIS